MLRWTARLASAAALADLIAASGGAVSSYDISDPMFGSCRLKGIAPASANFKLYASLSNKDVELNEACGRCVTVTRDDDPRLSTSAYVLNVCDGCASRSIQLSRDALAALDIRPNDRQPRVSYAFDTCPPALMAGDIKACIMEGASETYVPLQFFNSQKVITAATINGVPATSNAANFLFSANPSFPSSTWFENVDFSVTSDSGETLNSTLAFDSASGCATSTVQFFSASTADGVRGGASSASDSSSSGAIIGGVCGGVGALLLVVGSVLFLRRRKRAARDTDDPENELENQFLSPAVKPSKAAPSTSLQDDRQPLASPTVDYAESFSPAASNKTAHSKVGTMSSPMLMSKAPAAAPVVAASAPAKVLAPARRASAAPPASSPPVMAGARPTSPKPAHAPTTYAFSSKLDTSPSKPSVKSAPTLSAPVVHHPPSRTGFFDDDDDEENRSSFDIDDMRETEARAASIDPLNQLDPVPSFAPYSAADPYANTVTSPQSNVRATSLRRPGSKVNAAKVSGRGDSDRFANDSVVSDPDSYTSEAPRQRNGSFSSNGTLASGRAFPSPATDASLLSGRPSFSTDSNRMTNSPVRDNGASPAAQPSADSATSQRSMGSMRESGGYSVDSLNILGYPYSKKSGRQHNSTG
ncbi:unnamed protein product [Hyaloperonospora brassicae]|uniref:Expansin-like EG45 domain-containing protein n=1 Tax=Hyaloperonospora brassicae TaxID=162125 RepID=A0AAV0TLA7_HYABA|nr:unnamed protein product [Hyaloperonospora brassicae]